MNIIGIVVHSITDLKVRQEQQPLVASNKETHNTIRLSETGFKPARYSDYQLAN